MPQRFTSYGPSMDSLSVNTADLMSGTAAVAEIVQSTTPSDVFGPSSAPALQAAGGSPYFDWLLTGNVAFSVAVLVCLAGFCAQVYYFRPHIYTVLNIFRGTLYIDKVIQEHNYVFETFRKLTILSGFMVAGLIIVRYLDSAWGAGIAQALPAWARLLPVPAVWLGLAAVWFYQNLATRLAGWMTYSSKFTSDLVSLRNLGFSLLFLLSLPMMFIVVLAGAGALRVLSWILFGVVGFLLIFILVRTYMLFIRQKISILYWILYLCAVEILPVSFLVALAVRGLQY